MWLHKTMWLKDHVTLWVGTPHCVSPTCQFWWLVTVYVFSLSRDLAKLHNQRVIWLYGQEPIKVSYHPAKSGSHRLCVGDIMVLVCDIILKDHVTKGLSSFMGRVFQIELRGRGKRRNIARWIVFIGWGESSEK